MSDPRTFARLIPELKVADLERSLRFYVDSLGFTVRFDRPESRFAFLEREGAQIMMEEPSEAASKDQRNQPPLGRVIHLMIEVDDVDALYESV